MQYSFSKEQERLAKIIARNIRKLKDSGCNVILNSKHLYAYKAGDIRFSLQNTDAVKSHQNKISGLYCGSIDSIGRDDSEYFTDGYIEELND